jgi:superfamily II DNA or RNA helicase/HKD family nuclease
MGTLRRPGLVPGIYDEVVTKRVESELSQLGPSLEAVRQEVGSEGVASPLAALLRDALDLALDELQPEATLQLGQAVLQVLHTHAPKALKRAGELELKPQRLLSIVEKPAQAPARPKGSLLTSSLLVNAEGDSLLDHLRSEFDSADRVDLLCAFIKLSGFEKLRTAIERHCVERGRPLRLLTTTYMGASDLMAVERLARLRNVEVKVSFDHEDTRLHAKAWIFHRKSGFSTAYVGSSNLSHAAQTDGLEWNVRLTETDQPALVAQMAETFDQYWADHDTFESYEGGNAAHRDRLARALAPSRRGDEAPDFLPNIEPKDFQKPVLEELAAARRLGRHRNLLVAATGTGKTVMAALDYRALRAAGAVDTLLFVAHRREILEQSLQVYRSALQIGTFGELLFQGETPRVGRHVFASIDSLDDTDVSKFDMVVLDEAHHAAAYKWEKLMERVGSPKELLGLTGTPERADALDYEHHFPRPWVGNLRVWNCIPHALVPFRYYVLDVEGVNLRDVQWTAGRYVPSALADKLIGSAEIFVRRALRAINDCVGRPAELRAIAFCVNVDHANEVCRLLSANFRARVLTAETPRAERKAARDALNSGETQILCVVDLYNEGVDVPNVNALFFFRPTESATVFLQQLGRGLRRATTKAEVVVFDLTGRQHLEFRWDRRLRAMLGHTPRELRELVDTGFGRLPPGCHLHFDERAQEEVLEQLERAVPQDLRGLRELLRTPPHDTFSLPEFLHHTDVALESIYDDRRERSWTLLRAAAGLETRPLTDEERAALGMLHKLIHTGDSVRLDTWLRLTRLQRPGSEAERRVMRMLFVVLYGKELAPRDETWALWERHAIVREELAALTKVLLERNAFLAEPHSLGAEIPLVLHGRYSGTELCAAFDVRTQAGNFRDFFRGAVSVGSFELLLVTMEKDAKTKEHLRYRDFPLNERLFHWQSRSGATVDSDDARRLLERGAAAPLLFVREREKDDRGVTLGFQYLGPVELASASGERPITIEWKLQFPMPLELLRHGRVAA